VRRVVSSPPSADSPVKNETHAAKAAAPLDSSQLSPAMRQYQQFKAQYPGYVLFFRMGDFYEMFWEDAKLAHKTLGVTLTSRSRGGLGARTPSPWPASRSTPSSRTCAR
jgi:hypothetical protein